MKASANFKRVKVDGMVLTYYRFKIVYKDHTKTEKEIIRWAETAENAIKTLCSQYGWTVEQFDPTFEDEYCKAIVRVWVKYRKGMLRLGDQEGQNFFYRVEAWQSDN